MQISGQNVNCLTVLLLLSSDRFCQGPVIENVEYCGISDLEHVVGHKVSSWKCWIKIQPAA